MDVLSPLVATYMMEVGSFMDGMLSGRNCMLVIARHPGHLTRVTIVCVDYTPKAHISFEVDVCLGLFLSAGAANCA